jgi:hypothetical protein
MTTTPTPAEFLAQPYAPEEDLEPDVVQAEQAPPLALIADSLVSATEVLRYLAQTIGLNNALVDEVAEMKADRDELAGLLDRVQGESDAKSAKIDEILAICKPSTSKLANSIRATIFPGPFEPVAEMPSPEEQADPNVSPAETVAAFHCEICGSDTHDAIGCGDLPTEAPAPAENKGTAFELGPNASVADWRAYARMFGHTDVDEAEIPQLRALLGLPDPEAHNHDFRSGSTPNSCACGFVLPGVTGVPA